MATLTDNSLMPEGKYKGTAMVNVPASHLLWVYENRQCSPEVRAYVEANLDVIKKETNG